MIARVTSRAPVYWADEPGLDGWYPGVGEVYYLESLPAPVRTFLSEACQEDPCFLREYLMPALGTVNPHEVILRDLSEAIAGQELSHLGLGDLGKSFFKKVGKAIKKVAKKVGRATGVKVAEKVAKFVQKTDKRVIKEAEKIYRKDGDLIVGAVGAVLAPFTAGASLAAASLITGAHKMYSTKKAAEKAKKQDNQAAAALGTQAAAQEAQTTQQVDTFFSQNQAWFASHGITPSMWTGMTLQQKLDAVNSGATGAPVGSPTAPGAGTAAAAPSGGDSTSSSMVPGPSDGGADYSPSPSSPAAPSAVPVSTAATATAGASSLIIPALIAGGVILFSVGSKFKRNPERSLRSGLGRGKRRHPRRRW
jgi:hypothetical protein